jgi:hypothetical protein
MTIRVHARWPDGSKVKYDIDGVDTAEQAIQVVKQAYPRKRLTVLALVPDAPIEIEDDDLELA